MIKDKSIFIKNVYYMLSYAFQDLRPDREDDVAGEDFERIHDLFASILAKGIARQLKQGLYREYVNHVEDCRCCAARSRWREPSGTGSPVAAACHANTTSSPRTICSTRS